MLKTIQSVRRLREQAAKVVAALEKAIATQEQDLAVLKEAVVRQ